MSLGIPYANHGEGDKDGGEHCGGDDCVCHACIVPSERVIVKRENDLSGSSPHVSSIVHIEDDKAEEDNCDDVDDGHCVALLLLLFVSYAPIIYIVSTYCKLIR